MICTWATKRSASAPEKNAAPSRTPFGCCSCHLIFSSLPPLGDKLLNIRWQLQQPNGVRDGAAFFSGALADLFVAQVQIMSHAVERVGELDRVQIFALD